MSKCETVLFSDCPIPCTIIIELSRTYLRAMGERNDANMFCRVNIEVGRCQKRPKTAWRERLDPCLGFQCLPRKIMVQAIFSVSFNDGYLFTSTSTTFPSVELLTIAQLSPCLIVHSKFENTGLAVSIFDAANLKICEPCGI